MRVLQDELNGPNDRRVRLAIQVFCYRVKKYIGAFLACMGGADAIVFTGGIGENSPEIRAQICEGLEWAGLKLDHNRNRQSGVFEGRISTSDSTLHAFVIPTDEELLIARDTVRCVLGESHSPQLVGPSNLRHFGYEEAVSAHDFEAADSYRPPLQSTGLHSAKLRRGKVM